MYSIDVDGLQAIANRFSYQNVNIFVPTLIFLILLTRVIIAFLLPYINAYMSLVMQTFRSTMLEPANADLISRDVQDLVQPWIDRLTTYDFTGISYYRVEWRH